jgi:hypothetical protein
MAGSLDVPAAGRAHCPYGMIGFVPATRAQIGVVERDVRVELVPPMISRLGVRPSWSDAETSQF